MGANSKHNFNLPSMFNIDGKESLIYIARVESITDAYDGGRIKASISGVDDGKSINNIPYAYPIIPKHLNILPKVGEAVLILKTTLGNLEENRLWIGPIISQPQKLKEDPYFFTATSLMDGGIKGAKEAAPSTIAKAKGIYPEKQYIAIQGRNNNDIIFKDNDLLIRNGKHLPDDNLTFNKENISYIKIKNNVVIDDEGTKGGVTTIVSDKINLISHKGVKGFNITNQNDLISDDELLNIINNASPLVFGDKLNEFLELIKEFIANHVHPYPGLPPVKTRTEEKILNFSLDSILSKNIKIN